MFFNLKLVKVILLIIVSILLFNPHKIRATVPNDSLIFKNGNLMDGEIKSMDRGVAVVSTDYSDSDFKIEWNKIQKIHTQTEFFIALSDGRKFFGKIVSKDSVSVHIVTISDLIIECRLNDIVFLKPYKKSFFDRLYASIDVGLSLTKAQNLRQLSTRSTIGYRTRLWTLDASFNSLNSTQNDVEPIKRSDGKIDYRYVLPRNWYSIATVSLQSNTEQLLALRMNAQLGMGRFLIRTNYSYWGAKLGANRNIERYSGETPNRSSWEGYLGSELNLYDIGDLSLLTIIMVYPGITEKGRWRSDLNCDVKYDLPFDFYIKIGFTINYDNRPAEGASEADYVIQTGLGWEW